MIFDPLNNKEDIKCFAAVATSLNNYYPDADRSKNLYNIVIKGMKNTRTPQQKVVEIPEEAISETGIIDINLRDMKGNTRKLSELKGKAVIVDFTVYQSAVSATHNYMLRDLYDKYAAQGLEIYQVSLDADEHYWKTTADNLPWICVRDGNGIYSSIAASYNVKNVPSVFLKLFIEVYHYICIFLSKRLVRVCIASVCTSICVYGRCITFIFLFSICII